MGKMAYFGAFIAALFIAEFAFWIGPQGIRTKAYSHLPPSVQQGVVSYILRTDRFGYLRNCSIKATLIDDLEHSHRLTQTPAWLVPTLQKYDSQEEQTYKVYGCQHLYEPTISNAQKLLSRVS